MQTIARRVDNRCRRFTIRLVVHGVNKVALTRTSVDQRWLRFAKESIESSNVRQCFTQIALVTSG